MCVSDLLTCLGVSTEGVTLKADKGLTDNSESHRDPREWLSPFSYCWCSHGDPGGSQPESCAGACHGGSPWFSGPVASLFMLNCHPCCLGTWGEEEVCGSLPSWGPDRWVYIMRLRAPWLKSWSPPPTSPSPGMILTRSPTSQPFPGGLFLGSRAMPSHLSKSPLTVPVP